MLAEEYAILKQKMKCLNAQTDRLVLRRYKDSDQDGFLSIFSDPHTMEMDGDPVITEKNEEFLRRMEMIEQDILIFVCLEDKISHNFVGYVLINQYPHEEAGAVTLGCSLVPAYQHKGYGSEVAQEVIELLKGSGLVQKVLANAYDFNKPSLGLIRKMGFKFLHTIKNEEYYCLSLDHLGED